MTAHAPAPADPHGVRRRAPVQGRYRRAGSARRRSGCSTSTRPTPATLGRGARPRPPAAAERVYARVARETAARAGRGLPSRLRGRLRQPAGRRRGRPRRSRRPSRSPPAREAGTLPPFIGIRIKNLGDELRERALRTAQLFLERLLARNRRLAARRTSSSRCRRSRARGQVGAAGRRRSRSSKRRTVSPAARCGWS